MNFNPTDAQYADLVNGRTTPEQIEQDNLTVDPVTGASRYEQTVLDALNVIAKSGHELAGPALVRLSQNIAQMVSTATFPALSWERVIDDGKTFDAMRCPTCGNLVDHDRLRLVETSWRETEADADDYDTDRQMVIFYPDDNDTFETTGYLLHDGHAVVLPEGWTEDLR